MAACVCVAIVFAAGSAEAQTGRRAATVRGLDAHPLYFHGENIVLLVDVTSDDFLTWLVDGEVRVLALDVPPPAPGSVERLESSGPSTTSAPAGRRPAREEPAGARIADRLLGKPWPGVGELPVVAPRSPCAPAATTLRSVVLEPERYTSAG